MLENQLDSFPYECILATMAKPENIHPKIKITLTLPRGTMVVLERIRARRTQKGATRREIGASALVEEAIKLLQEREGI